MFATSGFFRGLNCPHYARGQGRTCKRPYCHFRHVRRDTDSNQSSIVAAAGKKTSDNQSSKINDGAKKSDYRSTSLPNWKKKKHTIGTVPRRDSGALTVTYVPTPPLLQKKQIPPRKCDFENPFGKSTTETEEYDPTDASLGTTSQKYSLDSEELEEYSPLGGGYDPLQSTDERVSKNKYTAEPDAHDSLEYDPLSTGGAVPLAEVEEQNKYAIAEDGPATDLEYDPLVNSSLEAVNPEKYSVSNKSQKTDEEYDPLEGQSSTSVVNSVRYSNDESDIGTLYGVDEYDPLDVASGGNAVDYIPSRKERSLLDAVKSSVEYIPSRKETHLTASGVEHEEYLPTVDYSISPLKRKASTDVCAENVKKLKQSKENGDEDDLHNWDMDAWFSEEEDENSDHPNKRRRDSRRGNKRQAEDGISDEDEALVIDLYDDLPSIDEVEDRSDRMIEIEDDDDDDLGNKEPCDVQDKDGQVDRGEEWQDEDDEGALVISDENIPQDTSDAKENDEMVKEPSKEPETVVKPRVSSEQLADFFTKRLQQPIKNKAKKKRVRSLSGDHAFKSLHVNKSETAVDSAEKNSEKNAGHIDKKFDDEKNEKSSQNREKNVGHLAKKSDDKKNEKSSQNSEKNAGHLAKKSDDKKDKSSENGKKTKVDDKKSEVASSEGGKKTEIDVNKSEILSSESGKKTKLNDEDKKKSCKPSSEKQEDAKSSSVKETKSTSKTVDKISEKSGQKSKGREDKTTTSEQVVKKSKKEFQKKSVNEDGAIILNEKSDPKPENDRKEKSDKNSEGKGSKTSIEKRGPKSTVQNGPSSIKECNIFSKLSKCQDETTSDSSNTSFSDALNNTKKKKVKDKITTTKENGNISKSSVGNGSECGSKERRGSADEMKKNKNDRTLEKPQTSKSHKSKVDKNVGSSNKDNLKKKQSLSEKDKLNIVKSKSDVCKQSKTSEKGDLTKERCMKSTDVKSKQKSLDTSSKIESSTKSKPSHKFSVQRSTSLKTTELSDRNKRTQSTDGKSRTKSVTSVDLFGSLSSESSEDISADRKSTALLDSAKALNKKVALEIYELSSSSDEMFHISKQVKEDLRKWDKGVSKSKNDLNSESQSSRDVYELSSDSDVDSIHRLEKVEALKKRYAEMMRKVEEQEREAAEMRRAAEAQLKQCDTIIRKRKSTSESSGRLSNSASSSRRYSEQELFGESSGDEVENTEVVFLKETSKDDIKPDVIDLLSSDESDHEQNATRKKKAKNLKVKQEKNAAFDVKQEALKKSSNKLESKHRQEDIKADKLQGTKSSSSSRSVNKYTKISSERTSSKPHHKETMSSSRDKNIDKQKRTDNVSKDKSVCEKSSKDKFLSKEKTRRPSKDKTKESSNKSDESVKRKSSSKYRTNERLPKDKTKESSNESDESVKRKSSSKDRTNERSKVCDKSKPSTSGTKTVCEKSKLKPSASRTKTVCEKSTKQKSSSSKNKTDKSAKDRTGKGENERAIESCTRKRKNSEMSDNDYWSDHDDVENHALSDAEIPEDFYLNDTDISFSETDTYDECLKIFNEETVKPLNDAKKKETLPGPDDVDVVPAVSVGKKRVAHAPKFGTGKMRKIPKKPKAQPSPAQVCHNRFFIAQQEALMTMKHDPPPQRVPTEFARPSAEKKRVAHTPKGAVASPRANSSTLSPSRRMSNPTSSTSRSSAPFVSPKQRIVEKKYSSVNRANSGWEVQGKTMATTADKGGRRMAHVPTKVCPRPVIPIGHGGKIPSVVRQRYLNLFIDEYLKTCDTEEEAFDHALKEEQVIHDRANSKPIYLNLSINYLKKLRNATADPTAPVPSSPPPKKALSHSAVIGGKGAVLHSFTLHRSAGKSVDRGVYYGKELYEKLKPFILTGEQLWDNGFPRSGVIPGQAEVKEDERQQKTLSTADPNQKVCARCGKSFLRRPDGVYITKESCSFHWGKLWRQKVGGILDHRFSCCSGDSEAIGCCVSKLHVTDDKASNLLGYMKTYAKTPPRDGSPGVYALDCEMCYTVQGMELTRVTVIDDKLQQVYDSLVKPDNNVVDYNTRFSGITEHDLKTVDTKLHNVQAVLLNMFSSETILLGHSLESDLLALKMIHNNVIDTSVVFPHKLGPPYKRALRTLMADFMKKLIQQDEGGHDSMEDAKSCMELMIWKLKEDAKTKR